MSIRTTYFGPRVSFRTTLSDVNADIVLDARPAAFLMSNSSVGVDGELFIDESATTQATLTYVSSAGSVFSVVLD